MKILIVICSLVLGFAGWALGLAAIVSAGNRKLKRSMTCTNFSHIACLGGVLLQYYDLVMQMQEKSAAASAGTLHVVLVVILVIAGLTVLLNLLAGLLRLVRKPKKEPAPEEKPAASAKPVAPAKPASPMPAAQPVPAAPSVADSAAAKVEKTED